VHDDHAAPSRRHSNVAVSVAENVKLAVVSVTVPDGPPEIVVSGAVVSTVQERVAGVASTFPATSIARTSKVCVPAATTTVEGVAHDDHAAASTRHWNVEPVSLASKAKLAAVALVGLAGEPVIVVVGPVRSTVQVYEAAPPALPAVSVAFTWKV
jgi:hypothetical protein